MSEIADPSHRPLVSVIIPAYNHAPYVEQAIASVLGQTYAHIELVVVDDGSTDDTLAVIERARAASGGRFEVVAQPNGGVSAALNAGLALTRGAFVSFLASDDWWAPDKTARQVALFAALPPSVGVVHGSSYTVDATGRQVATAGLYRPTEGGSLVDILSLRTGVVATSVLVRRAACDAAGGFDESMAAEDVDFYAAVVAAGYTFAYDPAPVVYKRITGDNLGAQVHRWFDVHHRTLDKHRAHLSADEYARTRRAISMSLGRTAAGVRDVRTSFRAYRQARREGAGLGAYTEFARVTGRALALSAVPPGVRHGLRQARARLFRRPG
ncbi:MAG TPA: glycosyltransferase family A protein [Rubricoccaceae bacterium]|jgi:glycosyltransferase involved in cell wall biosynthesis